MRPTLLVSLVSLVSLATGCPREVEHRYGKSARRPAPDPDENDPRVIKDGEDLYPAAVVERAEEKKRGDEDAGSGRGSGKPDESNGVCRLFAPKLASPACCEPEFGFDVETVRSACGLDTYLGESWQSTCGYYFHLPAGETTWFRASFINAASAKAAAESQARQLQRLPGADVSVSKVPNTKDAWWLTHDKLGWAYVGGWPQVRQLAWTETACNEEGLAKVLARLETAKVGPDGAKRVALVPTAR